MFPTDEKTWVYIVVSLLIGSIASVLAESVIKPAISAIGRALLRTGTFGLTSARDAIFRDIARRPTYRPAVVLLAFIVAISSYFVGVTFSRYQSHSAPSRVSKTEPNNLSKEEIEEYKRFLEGEMYEVEITIERLELLLAVMAFVLSTHSWARNSYIFSSISYFDQCLSICRPNLDESMEKHLLARFASIATKADFEALIRDLRGIADTHQLKLPRFVVL